MTPNEYQKEALRTANGGINNHRLLLNGAIGACSETGEALDILKKHLFQGHELDILHLRKELGDIAWYLAVSAAKAGIPFDDVVNLEFTEGQKIVLKQMELMPIDDQLMSSLVGLNTNTSKLLWYVYSLFTGDVDGAVSIKNLLSLCCFELSLSCHAIGATLQDICEENVRKLRTRYPLGFDIKRSLKREAGDE